MLTSVHAFATDPTRGVFILAILVLFIGGASRAVCLACADVATGRPVRADLARRRAGAQQPVPGDRLRHRLRRHALPARARSADRREDLGRGAILQRDLRAAVHAAADRRAVRTACWRGSAAICSASRSAWSVAAAVAAIAVAVIFATEGGGPILVPFAIGLAFFVMAGAVTEIVERTGLCRVPLWAAYAACLRPAALCMGHRPCAFRRSG